MPQDPRQRRPAGAGSAALGPVESALRVLGKAALQINTVAGRNKDEMLFQILVKLSGGLWGLKERCRRAGSGPVGRLWTCIYVRALQAKGSWISWDAELEGVPCFPHGIFGIFISGGARIGKSCVIFQQVTIGSNTLVDSKSLGAPHIGDNCYIGAGAKIVGKVRVGNNVRIGANAVVYRDVPDNSVVVSGEQKVITPDDTLNNRFYHTYDKQWRYYEDGKWKIEGDQAVLEKLDRAFGAPGP